MTMQSVKNRVGFSCDSCSETTEEFEDFNDAVADLKATGWKFSRDQGEWEHTCPGCVKKQENETGLQRAQRLLGK